jgi:hypothetical protein
VRRTMLLQNRRHRNKISNLWKLHDSSILLKRMCVFQSVRLFIHPFIYLSIYLSIIYLSMFTASSLNFVLMNRPSLRLESSS